MTRTGAIAGAKPGFESHRDSGGESVHDVQFTLMLSIALVVLVIFIFLRSVSATVMLTAVRVDR